MPVTAARAALVQEPFSRRIADDASAPGTETTIVLALADQAGADAYLSRVAPLAKAGLGRWQTTAFDAAFVYTLGDRVRVRGGEMGAAEDALFVVTGIMNDPNDNSARLTLRGPEPI